PVVPEALVLHHRQAFALHRVGDHHQGLAARAGAYVGEGFQDRVEVVSVDLPGLEAESPELLGQRLEAGSVTVAADAVGLAQNALAVPVDDTDEVGELLVAGEE